MKKFKKVIAGVTAIGLIIFLLLIANAWVGNPISKAIAKNLQ